MIGDGATDMEASPPAVSHTLAHTHTHTPSHSHTLTYLPQDLFIGFGGNVAREKVKEGATWFVYNFQELISELETDKHS